MCDGDLNVNAYANNWDMTCEELEYNIKTGQNGFECDSSWMELARFYCCGNYVAPESNLIFSSQKTKNKNKKMFFYMLSELVKA